MGKWSWKKTLGIGIPLFLGGFATSSIGFMQNVQASAKGIFPVEGPVSLAALREIPWHNDSISVVMMTTAWILLFKKCNASGMFYQNILSPVSKASYGMYLCHMFVLVAVTSWIRTSLGIGKESIWGIWTTPTQILLITTLSFIIVAIISILLQRVPKIGKWIMG